MTREEAIEIINRENDPNNKEVWEVFPEYREALDMAIEALKQEPKWIPVSERLPEYGEAVITVNSDDDYEINHIIDDDLNEWFYDGVVAWMPLPPCYEPKKVRDE